MIVRKREDGFIMKKTQRFLLFISGFFYLAVIVSLLTPMPWLTVIFFMLHSLSLLYFTYRSSPIEETIRLQGERDDLNQRLELLEIERNTLYEQLNQAKATSLSLEKELFLLQEERQELFLSQPPSTVSQEPVCSALLPPEDERSSPGEAIDLIHLAEETITELQSFADAVGLTIHISAAAKPLYIKVSPLHMRILFKNIIDNSIKYMNRSGSLIITISTVGDDLFIVLKDNGQGLSPDETPYIFELNYQGSNRISGNGLGLTQAKAIVETYGGTIYAKSTLHQGMGIYIQIPMNQEAYHG
jgi:signal transduction histidine kinase